MPRRTDPRPIRVTATLVLGLVATASCSRDPARWVAGGGSDLECSIPSDRIHNGGPGKDGIPALTNPKLIEPGQPGGEYLQDSDLVIGLVIDGEPIAVPLNILWWHEIVNLDRGGIGLAITHCPLTGSSLVFDRSSVGGAEFGVSGLLYMNNLIMYDRTTSESLWPQLARGARCGPKDRTDLTLVPAVESTWRGWRALHPTTRVVSSETGHSRDYRAYPYGNYRDEDNDELLFPMPAALDRRRPPKERVLEVVRGEHGGIALPYGALDELGAAVAVQVATDGRPITVLWERESRAAAAYYAELDGEPLTIRAADGRFLDRETGSVWRLDGRATDGPLIGRSLEAVPEAYVAYWFALAAFQPEIELWTPDP